MELGKMFVYVLIMIFGMGFFPLMQEAIIDKDMSSWTFTGAAFLKTLFPVFPYVWLGAFIAIPGYMIMRSYNNHD